MRGRVGLYKIEKNREGKEREGKAEER